MTVKEWLDESTPDRREVVVCFDRRLVSELVKAKAELEDARSLNAGMLGDNLTAYTAAVADLEEAVRAKSRTLVFEGVGWGRWRDIISKNPPVEDQASTFSRAVQLGFMPHAVENITYNAETFVPAALAASCTDPGMTVHEATTLLRKAPPGVIERLWAAVLEVNLAGASDPFVGSAGASAAAPTSAKKSKRP